MNQTQAQWIIGILLLLAAMGCNDFTWPDSNLDQNDGDVDSEVACVENQKGCDGAWTTICQTGVWVRITDCSENGQSCKEGHCINSEDGDLDFDFDDQDEEFSLDGDEPDTADTDSDSDLDRDANEPDLETETEHEGETDAPTGDRDDDNQSEIEPETDEESLCEDGPCCQGGVPVAIGAACLFGQDSLACTDDACGEDLTCKHTLQSGKCLIGGVCYSFNQDNPENDCQYCVPIVDPNQWQNKTNGTGCNDKDDCTHTDQCDNAGHCDGTLITCTSNSTTCGIKKACNGTNICTEWYPGDTQHPDVSCDDQNLCTHTDKCDGTGTCVGLTVICSNDNGICAAKRSCNGTDQCTVSYAEATTTCETDNLSCTNDHCDGGGTCLHERIPYKCLIDNSCYDHHQSRPGTGSQSCEWCDAGSNGWEGKPAGELCNDGEACTYADQCLSNGSCQGTPYNCNGHGACNGNLTCSCDSIYTGIACDSCLDRFSGYPNCTSRILISAGHNYSCGIASNGRVKCWGSNSYGQLGDGLVIASDLPKDVVGLLSGYTAVDTAYYHSCALTSTGGVKCWGGNSHGQLGNGTTENSLTPVGVEGLSEGVTSISAGGYLYWSSYWGHSCALLTNGGLKCWGSNDRGQLGDGTNNESHVPIGVSGLASGVIAIGTGYYHTCALLASGGVKCWGSNGSGQLGNESTTNANVPTAVSGLTSGVSDISVGGAHSCAILSNGGVKCWGYNLACQIGDGTCGSGNNKTKPVDVIGLESGVLIIAAGETHTCAYLETGVVKCWGSNDRGQLGNGTSSTQIATPVEVMGISGGVSNLSAGYNHTCAYFEDGKVKCWGDNYSGALGDGDAWEEVPQVLTGLPTSVALDVGYNHSCAVLSGGELKCWGYNFSGQVGDGTSGNGQNRTIPTTVSGLANAVAKVSAGGSHTCALLTGGGVKCWGDNFGGQLGNDSTIASTVPADVSGLANGVSFLSTGQFHSCAILSTSSLKCWGYNDYGQIGDGTSGNGEDKLTPTNVYGLSTGVSKVAAGSYHTCAILSGGVLKCWGRNFSGQIGDNSTTTRTTPKQVNGLTSDVISIAAGEEHTCALLSSGAVKCWGSNGSGQIGDGTTNQRNIPTEVSGLSSGVTALAAGSYHSCAILESGAIKCWGGNGSGQLGIGVVGGNMNFPTDVVGITEAAIEISCGYLHTCALLTSGKIACWGSVDYGQLGTGIGGYGYYSSVPIDVAWP